MNGVIDIEHDVVTKFPKEPRENTAMFLTAGNGLSDQSQKQDSLDLQEAAPKASVSHLTEVNGDQ